MDFTPPDVIGLPVIIEQPQAQNIRGVFLDSALQLPPQLCTTAGVGVDLVSIVTADDPIWRYIQRNIQQLLQHSAIILVRQGLHYTLLDFKGVRAQGYLFAGNVIYTKPKVVTPTDDQAQSYLETLAKAEISLN